MWIVDLINELSRSIRKVLFSKNERKWPNSENKGRVIVLNEKVNVTTIDASVFADQKISCFLIYTENIIYSKF